MIDNSNHERRRKAVEVVPPEGHHRRQYEEFSLFRWSPLLRQSSFVEPSGPLAPRRTRRRVGRLWRFVASLLRRIRLLISVLLCPLEWTQQVLEGVVPKETGGKEQGPNKRNSVVTCWHDLPLRPIVTPSHPSARHLDSRRQKIGIISVESL